MADLTLSQACAGMIYYKQATGVSPYTLRNYRTSFAKLQAFLPGDPPIASIQRADLIRFFAWLQNDYISEPDGVAPRGKIKLSPKSILNIHAELSALWTWAVNEGFVETNLVRSIASPKANPPVIEPFTAAEISTLIKYCEPHQSWRTQRSNLTARTARRDRALILLLLDTGLRASELCNVRLSDVSMTAHSVKVIGKGHKERVVFFGKRTARALWHYITPRAGIMQSDDPLFIVSSDDDDPRPFTRHTLRKRLARLGQRAGVAHVYPHRFRHTFAITYLRNGGDLFTLQALLGHSDLTMVRRYARIAQTDCARVHHQASPVDNWKL